MAKTDALYLLIKSLTKSEKRYFKLISGTTEKQKNYLSLFEVLDRQERYDQKTLRKKFSHQSFSRQLHVAKNYLSNLIMKSLRGYHQHHSVNALLKSCLVDIEILFRRDMLTQCLKTIKKAEKLASRIDDHRSMLEILNWKRKVLLNISSVNDVRDSLNTLIRQEQEILDDLKNESTYWSRTINLNTDEGPVRPKDHERLNTDAPARTHRAKILQFHLRYISETMAGNPEKAMESIDKLIRHLEKNPDYLKHDPGPYITALNNKIGLYLNQNKYQKVPAVLNKIREIPEKAGFRHTSPMSMKLLVRTYNVELETYRDSGQFLKGVDMIPGVRSFLAINKENITDDYLILLHYQFAYLYFMVGNFGKALRDINVVLNYRFNSERADVVGFARLLNMIIHYELGNYTVMRYSVDSTRRFLKKRGNLMDFERILLKLFSRLSTQPENHHSKLFSEVCSQLFGPSAMMNESHLDYLDLRHWINSKIKKHQAGSW